MNQKSQNSMPLTFEGDYAESLRYLTQELRAAFYELDQASDQKHYEEDIANWVMRAVRPSAATSEAKCVAARVKIQDVARALSVVLVAQNASGRLT